MNGRSAFTLIELMIVVVIAAILMVAALPDADSAAKEEGDHAAKRFEADVYYARSLCIARPDDPVVLKLDGLYNRYWMAKASSPDTPITHPQTGDPYVVQFGPGGDRGLNQVRMVACDFDGDLVLGFDSQGSTDQDTPAILQLTSGGADYEVAVDPVATNVTISHAFSLLSAGGTTFLGE